MTERLHFSSEEILESAVVISGSKDSHSSHNQEIVRLETDSVMMGRQENVSERKQAAGDSQEEVDVARIRAHARATVSLPLTTTVITPITATSMFSVVNKRQCRLSL
jgi:hypothetical protein